MQDKYQVYANDPNRPSAADIAAERREQAALDIAHLRAEKEKMLARQRSIDTPPATRIALWESRHGLSMPRDPQHPLMGVIARNTDLAAEQVLAEHRRRALLRAGH
jgi:hypothetical protein